MAIALQPVSATATPAPFAEGPVGVSGLLPLSPASQANAVRAAKNYLETMPFSRTGLIKQLQYEEYSTADATYAVDNITVNWNAQAARSAKNYIEMMAFSRSGLIDQLLYEGYTSSQATYGVNSVGL